MSPTLSRRPLTWELNPWQHFQPAVLDALFEADIKGKSEQQEPKLFLNFVQYPLTRFQESQITPGI